MQRPRNDSSEGNDADPSLRTNETLEAFEKLVSDLSLPKYVFRLYIAGNTARSGVAISNVRKICERYLAGRYELEVIDVYQQPGETKRADVIALPTLVKELPVPRKRFVGDMSNTERIVIGLKLED